MARTPIKKPAKRGKTNKDRTKTDETGKLHARLSASESKRWMNCPGSVQAIEALPDYLKHTSSSYAQEGVAAHTLGEICLLSGERAEVYIGKQIKVGDGDDAKMWEVDKDMADAVQVYLDEVADQLKRFPDAELRVERKFDLSWLRPEMFGTNDASVAAIFDTLIITDYKHGKGVPVQVEHNTQLMYYALGAAKEDDFNYTWVELVVVQPRCQHAGGGVRRWRIPMSELEAWGMEELGPAADATRDPKAKLRSGDWCTFCANKGLCPALTAAAFDSAVADFKDDPYELPSPTDNGGPALEDPIEGRTAMTDKEMGDYLSHALKWIPSLELWIKSVRSTAYHVSERSVEIPDFKLIQGEANRSYALPEPQLVKELRKVGLKPAEMYDTPEPKLKSPAQMEKISKAVKAIMPNLTERKPGGRKLVPITHKSPAVSPNADFDAVDGEDFVD